MKSRIGKTVAYGVLAGASFAGIGKGIDVLGKTGVGNQPYVYGYDTHDLKTAHTAVSDSKRNLEKVNTQTVVLRQKIGESCVTFLTRYIGSGDGFLDTSMDEGIVISDALAEPSLPCGDSQSNIRFAYAGLVENNREKSDATASLQRAKSTVADFEERIADDADFSGARAGGLFGAAAGLIIGGIVAFKRPKTPQVRSFSYDDDPDEYDDLPEEPSDPELGC